MLGASFLGMLHQPITYYSLKIIIDTLSKPAGFTRAQLYLPLGIYCGAQVLLNLIARSSDAAQWNAEPFVRKSILVATLKQISSYRFRFFQHHPSGNVSSKINGLVDGYNRIWAQLYQGMFQNMLAVIIYAVSVYIVHFYLGVLLTGWSMVFIGICYYMNKKLHIYSYNMKNAYHEAMGILTDSLSNMHAVKLLSGRAQEEKILTKNLHQKFIPAQKAFYKYNFLIKAFCGAMYTLMLVMLLWIMIQLAEKGKVSMGDFVFIFGAIFSFCDHLWKMVIELPEFVIKMGDLRASFTVLEAEQSEYLLPSAPFNPKNASIEFKNIYFTYEDGKKVFENFNFSIKSGEKVGIVGFTGSGKTTLINLLLKLIFPDSGQIIIGGQDIANIDPDKVRKIQSLIPQDITLFHRSIADNIRYSRPAATDKDMIQASSQARVHAFVAQMSQGYDTPVGEKGMKLSGGQRQRIAIARAILKDASILILDEATSALDSITEKEIHASLETAMQGKTVLAIAHRLSTLRHMDRIVVLDQGKIIEQGDLHSLLAIEDGLFKKLWQSQTDGMILPTPTPGAIS